MAGRTKQAKVMVTLFCAIALVGVVSIVASIADRAERFSLVMGVILLGMGAVNAIAWWRWGSKPHSLEEQGYTFPSADR